MWQYFVRPQSLISYYSTGRPSVTVHVWKNEAFVLSCRETTRIRIFKWVQTCWWLASFNLFKLNILNGICHVFRTFTTMVSCYSNTRNGVDISFLIIRECFFLGIPTTTFFRQSRWSTNESISFFYMKLPFISYITKAFAIYWSVLADTDVLLNSSSKVE